MFHRWAALLLVLALCAMSPKTAAGQTQSTPRGQKSVRPPYPNPFNPQIHIPFPVEPTDGCADANRLNSVTVRISNILSQEVAIPVLEDGSLSGSLTTVPQTLVGARLSNTKLVCGDYQAFWDGFVKGTTKEAASGTYLVQVFVNGKPTYSVRILNRK